ncbi:MAG: hypothetical protein WCS03_18920 [Bacteroidota bacterium]
MLNIENSCEIGDLIREITVISGKSWNEVEAAMFVTGKYPESGKTYLTDKFGPYVRKAGLEWLNDAIAKAFVAVNITECYVTRAI